MSYSPAQMFPGAFDPDVAFLGGKFKDSSAPGVYDGSPLSTILFNQEQAFWDAVMIAGGEVYNNSADTPATSQLFKALQQSRQVEPLNNDWNGFFDPKHQAQLPSPAGYPATSGAGGTVYGADDEWSLGNYSSGAANTISADDDGVIFSVGTYKLFTFTSEQLALIDVNKVPVYLVDETGKRHFVNNATNGVNVTKPDATTLKVELTNAIFTTLSITKVWEFFVTEKVGVVTKLSPDALAIKLINHATYHDVTASYSAGINYTNNRKYPVKFYFTYKELVGLTWGLEFSVDGQPCDSMVLNLSTSDNSEQTVSAIVNPNQNFIVNITGNPTKVRVVERRL